METVLYNCELTIVQLEVEAIVNFIVVQSYMVLVDLVAFLQDEFIVWSADLERDHFLQVADSV